MKVSGVVDGRGWMKDDDDNTMPVWVYQINILVDDNAVPDKEESFNDDYEGDEPAAGKSDYY